MEIRQITHGISLTTESVRKPAEPRKPTNESEKVVISANSGYEIPDRTKAVFALTEDKRVVVRILDDKGEVVSEFPPEEYQKMVKGLKQAAENIYHKEV